MYGLEKLLEDYYIHNRHLRGCPVCDCAYWCDCETGEDCPPECDGCTGAIAEDFYAAQDRMEFDMSSGERW